MPDPTPICIPCHQEMSILKTGVLVLTGTSIGPYKIQNADLWRCKTCGAKQLKGFANKATYHHEPSFSRVLNEYDMQPEEYQIFVKVK